MPNDLGALVIQKVNYYYAAIKAGKELEEKAAEKGLNYIALMEDAYEYAKSMAKFRSNKEENQLMINSKDFLAFWRRHEGDARYAAK